ncbi:MAG: penicillin-binding protein 2 [Rhodobacteraceae bacterium]|jgi:cell division protein FtsI (penicillin-binding protein 3)|nr:penicillin-binding protein 2 [Paracoccaceae bacterium]
MIRRPLRPLARVLSARARGENPDAIEAENRRLRHEAMRDRARGQAEGRLLVLGMCFISAFVLIGAQMATLAQSPAEEPRTSVPGADILATRADVVDRRGRVLATNLATRALYAHPDEMIDPARTAAELARIFPDMDEARLLADFTGKRRFLWLRRTLSPEQVQAVHDIGEPGLNFAPREMRLYPNGALAAHVLGGAQFGREGVSAAEVIGTAGVERTFDAALRDPAGGGRPVTLSIDLTVQAATETILDAGMRMMNARAASAVIMDVHTGEIVAMASLPDFDPNSRPAPPTQGSPADSPIFNHALQGVYELGSTFKVITIAQALDLGLVSPSTIIDTRGPMTWGRFRIRDFRNYGPELSVTDVIVKSSNIGTARIAGMIGIDRQQDFLRRLGFFDPTPVEMAEAPRARPIVPQRWSEISMLTISYGHGLSASPVHLAAAYASLVNGGTRVTPTILRRDRPELGDRVVSEATSAMIRSMLRDTVTDGTATMADVPGYAVGGKTGTADKVRATGGYYDDKVMATFAGVFPAHDPRYVFIVSLDEPEETTGVEPRRTAGWTVAPVAGELVRQVAPLLGVRPSFEPGAIAPAAPDRLTLARN